MKYVTTFLCCMGLLVSASSARAQLKTGSLVRSLLKTPSGASISPALRQSLAQLTPQQLAQVTAQLQRANTQLAQQNAQTRQFQEHLFQMTRPAVFRALPPATGPRNSFTGTLFQTDYRGKREVYGVIPMHALQDEFHTPGLVSYKFTALAEINGEIKPLPAWVVQLSSSKTADVALVKFAAKDQDLLSPLSLAAGFPPRLYAQGYACNLLSHGIAHVTGHTSAGLLRTRIPAAQPGERAGFCGSPLVDEKGALAAVHVGSSYTAMPQQENPFFDVFSVQKPAQSDPGYAVPAEYLSYLVEAYHQPKKAVVPLLIRGQEIIRLRINEYVNSVELLDQNHQVLWQHTTRFKVSLRPVEKALVFFPQARFIRLKVGQTHWQKGPQGWFVQDDESLHRVVVSGIPGAE